MDEYDRGKCYIYRSLSSDIGKHVMRNHAAGKEAHDGLDALLDEFSIDDRVKAIAHDFALRVHGFCERRTIQSDRHIQRHAGTIRLWGVALASVAGATAAALYGNQVTSDDMTNLTMNGMAGGMGGAVVELAAGPIAWCITYVERTKFKQDYALHYGELALQFLQKLERYEREKPS